MAYGGNDWLALTQEPTLEPEIAICDPHHHFWDFRSARIPYQRYLLHELIADVDCGHNVRSTVFIEARAMYRPGEPVELRPVGEVEFVQGLAAASVSGLYGRCRAASAIVGHADLKLADRVEPVLEALQAASPNRFRGIRHTVTWDPHPEVENREKEGVLATAEYQAGARVLARMGLSLDTGVCFPQLPELAEFARAVPDLMIILNHLGGLNRVGPPTAIGTTRSWPPGEAASPPSRNARTSTSSWAASACRGLVLTGTLATSRSAQKSWPPRWGR
jgi:predicted TIM-barrel fold metal-dependent hydrolase